MQFSQRLTVVDQPIELTQEQWEAAKREVEKAMAAEFGEQATTAFLKGIAGAPPSFITIKDYTVK